MNRKVEKYFFSINRMLGGILLVCIVSIVLMDVVFAEELAPNKTVYYLSKIYSNLCLAYCASFIFYVLTVYIPNKRRKLSLYKYLNNKLSMIHKTEEELLNAIMTG